MAKKRTLLSILGSTKKNWWLSAGIIPLAVYQPIGAKDWNKSNTNLIDNTVDLSEVGRPVWNADSGWNHDGGSYRTTTIIPDTTGQAWSMLVKFSDTAVGNTPVVGKPSEDGGRFYINPNQSGGVTYGNGGYLTVAAGVESGILGFSGNLAYRNGVQESGVISSDPKVSTKTIRIGGVDGFSSFSGNIQALVIFNTILTPLQMNIMYQKMLALSNTNTVISPLNGAWCWFGNPRAVHYNNTNEKTYFGGVSPTGDILVGEYNHTSSSLTHIKVKLILDQDDHANPQFLIRESDKKLLLFYSQHNGSTIYINESTSTEDGKFWTADNSIDSDLGGNLYSYPTPIQLTGEENDPIYLIYRAESETLLNTNTPHYSKSSDGGTTWASQKELFSSSTTGLRPYILSAQNGDSRIDFVVTDAHPSEKEKNSFYHFYYTGSNWYKSDGTLIGNDTQLPLTSEDVSIVYSGDGVSSWILDIAIDTSGNPIVVYSTFPDQTWNTTAPDHRYNYARWTGTEWITSQICSAGGSLYSGQPYYSGGACIDKSDVSIIYCSVEENGSWNLYKYSTSNNGLNWVNTSKIASSAIRPVVSINANANLPVLWMNGTYTTYEDYNTNIKSGIF